MNNGFGPYVRQKRLKLLEKNKEFSLRKVAHRIGVQPSYLSKIERGENATLSEMKIRLLAEDMGENPDLYLALSGKVSSDVLEVIRKRPELFSSLIRELKDLPKHAVLRIVREVRDGEW